MFGTNHNLIKKNKKLNKENDKLKEELKKLKAKRRRKYHIVDRVGNEFEIRAYDIDMWTYAEGNTVVICDKFGKASGFIGNPISVISDTQFKRRNK